MPPLNLSPQEFERAATLGLGRAILYARQPDAILDEDVIQHLMLHNTAYDPQIEGTRGWYVMQLIEATHHEKTFVQTLQQALEASPPSDDDWDEVHRMWIAGLFVEAGHTELRKLLYDRTLANIDANSMAGIESIVSADGAAGIAFLVEHFTRSGYDLVDLYHHFIYLFDDDDEIHKLPVVQKMKALAEVERAAHQENRPFCPTYSEFRDEMAKNSERLRSSPGAWVRQASGEDLLSAAADMLALPSEDQDRFLAYLAIFTRQPFPLDPQPLIALARNYHGEAVRTPDYKTIPEHMIPFRAFRALEKITHPEVRAFALEAIDGGVNLDLAVGLLESNFNPGDWPLIEGVVSREHPADDLHGLGMSVKMIARAHPEPDAVPVLASLIERDSCSECRYNLLRALRTIGPLPQSLADEASCDSNEDTRDWAAEGFPV